MSAPLPSGAWFRLQFGRRWRPFCMRSGQTDPPDLERERAGLACRDHQSDLADARRVEWRCVGDPASAEAGAEVGQRQVQGLPVGALGGETGLVVQAVEAVVGQQAELELLVIAAQFDLAGRGASQASFTGSGPHRCKAAVTLQRDGSLEHGVTCWVVAQCAARDAAHHAVVDGLPRACRTWVGEVEQRFEHDRCSASPTGWEIRTALCAREWP